MKQILVSGKYSKIQTCLGNWQRIQELHLSSPTRRSLVRYVWEQCEFCVPHKPSPVEIAPNQSSTSSDVGVLCAEFSPHFLIPVLRHSAFNDPRLIQVMGVLMGIDMQAFSRPEGSNEMPQGFEPSSPIPPTPSAPTSKPAPSPTPASSEPHNSSDVAMAEPEEDEDAKDKAEALKEKQLGNDAYKKRNFDEAEKHFAAAWDKWPKDITFLTNLAGECLLVSVVHLASSCPSLYAAVHFEKGDFPKTIEVCEKAIEEGRSVGTGHNSILVHYADCTG